MSSAGSVTAWLGRLKAGEAAAARPLWERYSRRLVRLAEGCRALLDRLGDADLRAIALLKMENYTAEETAARPGCVPRTARRRLRRIRSIWEREGLP
jgi:DNA-directed RNA polymerase specialized sigma24 family protein